MFIDRTKNLSDIRNKITGFIKIRGPSLPIHIAKETGLSLLLSSAFLSDLVSQKEIRITNMKVGGSPLYYIQGQEAMLENFFNHLGSKERESITILKERKILVEEELEPAIRVALRSLKDFAIPLRIEGTEKIFWKYYLFPELEAKTEIERLIAPKIEPKKEEVKVEPPKIEEKKAEELTKEPEKEEITVEKKEEHEEKKAEPKIEKKAEAKPHEKKAETKPEKKEDIFAKEPTSEKKTEKKPKPEKPKDPRFLEEVKSFLKKKDIEMIEELFYDKRDVLAKVKINSNIGSIMFLLIAKDKKKLVEDDLILAYHQSQEKKMPCLFLSRAEVNKKLEEQLKNYENLVKIDKL